MSEAQVAAAAQLPPGHLAGLGAVSSASAALRFKICESFAIVTRATRPAYLSNQVSTSSQQDGDV